MAHLVLHFRATGREFVMRDCDCIIAGALPSCDLPLREYVPADALRTVSRRHFRIAYDAGSGYALYDLASTNGTAVGRYPVPPGEPKYLRDGDIITLCDDERLACVVRIRSEEGPRDESAPDNGTERMAPRRHGPVMSAEGLHYATAVDRFYLDGKPIADGYLTPTEHRLLTYLYERAEAVCSYNQIMRDVWRIQDCDNTPNDTFYKTLSNLRQKLDKLSHNAGERHVVTVHGRGLKCVPVQKPRRAKSE